ncbi:MAG TPA: helix-turn-helix transcriptional regulator [Pseudonocardiaceae bacterium]|nr:helix-turn-helix transcriptional regulator [Pseudonocardiaceae bacterium]
MQFGRRLRILREDARLTGKDLAARLGWAQSKVSRLENGKQTATLDDVEAWAQAVRASAEQRATLVAELRDMRFEYATWKYQLRSGTARRQRANLPLEANAALVRVFVPDMIPGLLQTAEYARHVFARLVNLHGIPNDIEEGVRTRMQRQQVLYDPTKRFRFLLTEAALHYRICPPSVLRGQLDRLSAAAGLNTITIAIIPFRATLPVVPSHAFTMFDDTLVLVETIGAELSFRASEERALYIDVFERLWKVGVQDHNATALINKVIEELQQ